MVEGFMSGHFKGHGFEAGGSGSERIGPTKVSQSVDVTVGEGQASYDVDPEHLHVGANASVVTIRGDAHGHIDVSGVGSADGSAHAQGPAAQADVSAGTDGVNLGAGVSAGSAGASLGGDVLGQQFHAGAEVGLKAEAGLHIGATTRVDLPLISLEGPNPGVAAASWAANAAGNLAKDPVGTMEGAAKDVLDTANDGRRSAEKIGDGVSDAVGGAFSAVKGFFGSDDKPDDHAVTNDVPGGPRAKPGTHPID